MEVKAFPMAAHVASDGWLSLNVMAVKIAGSRGTAVQTARPGRLR